MSINKFILLSFFIPLTLPAQNTYYETIFGDTTDNCTGVSIEQLVSGNFVVAANSSNIITGSNVIQLYKFDKNGTELMHITFPLINNERVFKMKGTPDGHLLFAGIATDSTGNGDGLLMKTDTSGNIIWRSVYGRPLTEESLQGIGFTSQGEILSSGYTKNQTGSGHSLYLIKTDTAGGMLWDQQYDSAFNSYSDAVIVLINGDIIISGDRQRTSGNYTNAIIHTDSAGNLSWELDLPNAYNNGCKNDYFTSNGDVIIVGESATATSFSFDPSITRLDTSGNIKWNYIYNGSPNSTDAAFDMIEPLPENYLVTGYALNPANNSADVMLMRIDSSGTEISRTYFGDSMSVDIGLAITKNQFASGCYITGTTVRNQVNRGYLIYTDLLGIPAAISDNHFNNNDIVLYPNPADDLLYVIIPTLEKYSISIFDITGNRMLLPDALSQNIFSIKKLASGIYFANIELAGKIFRKPFIVLH